MFWYPKEGGIESLPKGFLDYLDPDAIHLNTTVIRIDARSKKLWTQDSREYSYDVLISSIPLPVIIGMIDEVPQEIQAAAGKLIYNTVYTVLLGIERAHISEHHWVYFQEEDFIFHRISYPMNFAPSMAPEGCSSIMAEISHSRWKNMDRRDLIGEAIDGLQRAGILRSDDLITIRDVCMLKPAYIIYDLHPVPFKEQELWDSYLVHAGVNPPTI